MFIYHLLFLQNLILYFSFNLFILFLIHFTYGHIFIYFLFSKVIVFHNLYAISFYEILLTKIYFSSILTLLNIIPLIFVYLILYLKSGLYQYELYKVINGFKYYIINSIIYILISISCLPLILKNENTNYNIIQIYSYTSMSHLIIKIIMTLILILIIPTIYKNLNKKAKYIPRSYIIPIIIILIIFGPLALEIQILIKIIIGIQIYLEMNNIGILWVKNRKF